ncbi:MAG TPA: TaqI-like C-terminal specificity domain-containing protein [Anaerolineae bacterium]|nr:TaqI-like C-terminal specificity domain-containing protein [Anaerolineae bacterium]HQH38053.1 TaqI-like C-terminal specificity domain-containing protein [Anaerolineae bacterium]
MPNTNPQRVLDLLHRMPSEGLNAAKRLFWTELNYDRAAESLSTREWPDGTRALVNADPLLLAQHTSTLGSFDILYIPLASEQTGRSFPLSLAAERAVITQLLPNHPYALFVFSDAAEKHWHLVNVKYRRDKADGESAARRVLRRIAIGPHERLRTAAERIAMLDLTTLSPNLADGGHPLGLSPIAIQQRHDDAFDVEAVTKAFFTTYREHFERAEVQIAGLDDADAVRIFTQRLFNRLLFIVFLERKGWLIPPDTGKPTRADGYLAALWDAHRHSEQSEESNFYRDRLKLLFFSGLNNPGSIDITGIKADGPLAALIGRVPYLNGGLFEQEDLDEREGIAVPDAVFSSLFDDLLYHYNFTVTESTPLDVEVAVDPEMLGKIFEELVTGRHESGSYYTPKPVVAFMCREALKGYLHDACPREAETAIAAFVEERDASDIRQPEAVLAALRAVKVCDLACGSGAYLLGMLHELMELRQALFVSRHLDARSAYERKLEIIQNNLYGVDIDPFAVNIARLRLWLSLIVDYDGDDPPPLPNLEFKIEVGDSLTAPAPAPLQPDLFRQQDVADFFILKGQFMTAHGPEKKTLKARIDTLKASIAKWASEESGADAFDWAVDFAEVFTPQADAATLRGGMTDVLNATTGQMQLATSAAPGFDIIVANPPYVRQELLGSDLKAKLKKRYPDVYTGTADLYVYFYARALDLLREGGIASFITSNKWLRAGYGEKLRQHLNTKTTVQAVIDFGDLPVFGAIAYPQIIIFRKHAPPQEHTLRALTVDDLSAVEHLSEVVQAEAWEQPRASLRADGWVLAHPTVTALLEKLRAAGKPLDDYMKGRFYRGIVTGYNEAFIVDYATRNRLIAEHPSSVEVLKPFLRGRDVKRWIVDFAELWLLFIPWHFPLHEDTSLQGASRTAEKMFKKQYPAVYDHLSLYKEALSDRNKTETGVRYEWYALQRCAATYYKEFELPQIVWGNLATRPNFAFAEAGYYLCAPANTIPTDDKFLLGILNSQVTHYLILQSAAQRQGGFVEFKPMYVSQIPIPDPTPDQRAAIEGLVRRLLDARGQGPQVSAWEAELNALVYQVYGLTAEEIKVVEGS